MSLTASGLTGELRKGYQVVARLSGCTLSAETARVDGIASDVNTFWIDQPPFSLWLKFGSRHWVWRETEVIDSGSPFAIRLHGSPDVRD